MIMRGGACLRGDLSLVLDEEVIRFPDVRRQHSYLEADKEQLPLPRNKLNPTD